MRLAWIETRNWRCFRGEQHADLGPGAHAIVARHERDAERSNWLGKSSLLWAIRFGMTGERPGGCRTEDDWISRGEPEGAVVLLLDDGTLIERRRRRGGPTVLTLRTPDGRTFGRAEAQAEIERVVGMAANAAESWFLGQKRHDRFVGASPGERAREVAGWLRLEPLQRAEVDVRMSLSRLMDDELRLSARERAETDALAAALRRAGVAAGEAPESAIPSIEERRARAEAERADAERRIARLEVERRELAEARADERRAREREELAREVERAERDALAIGAEAESAMPKMPSTMKLTRLRTRFEQAGADAERQRQTARDRRVLARGEFDGACPVGGIRCPAKDELNARQRENAAAAREAAENASTAQEAADAARRALDAAATQARAAERLCERAQAARDHAVSLRARLERFPVIELRTRGTGESVETELAESRRACEGARDEIRDLDAALAEIRRLVRSIAEIVRTLADNRAASRTKRESLEILGRRGAQRRIAEAVLVEVRDEANALLSSAGVDLTVDFSWERETQGLAQQCEICGAAFPASQRVKECARCGAARGPKLDERLDVELSDRSGAAEDLAGLAISLASASMLRRDRGSSWGLLCLDEPFGALDRAHRRALSRGLVQMLAGRWEQALIIAHDEATLDAMPGRILITAGDGGSRYERA